MKKNVRKEMINARIKQGVSRSTMAKRLDVTTGAISNWENGLRTPRDEMILKVANEYGVSVEQITKVSTRKSSKRG